MTTKKLYEPLHHHHYLVGTVGFCDIVLAISSASIAISICEKKSWCFASQGLHGVLNSTIVARRQFASSGNW